MCESIDPMDDRGQQIFAGVAGLLLIAVLFVWADIESAGPVRKEDGIGLLPPPSVYKEYRDAREQQWLDWSGINRIRDWLIVTR